MSYRVRVGEALTAEASAAFGPLRSPTGRASEWDFWSGPLAAALIGFRAFDELPAAIGPSVRTLHLVDPVFGAIVFVGVLVAADTVELAEYEADPEYWALIEDDPND